MLQPTKDSRAQENLERSIYRPRSREEILALSTVPPPILDEAYPSGEIFLWGTDPGFGKLTKWRKVRPGDFVAFTWDSAVRITAVVVATEENESLARQVWGDRGDGETWRYLYYVRAVERCEVPWDQVGPLVGHPSKTPQAFTVVTDPSKTRPFRDFFRLQRGSFPETVSSRRLRTELKALRLDETDRKVERAERLEHAAVVAAVFGRAKEADCALCGSTLPRSLLVAAHIKKRARASLDERLDVHNIAMPLCIFGCDALFERGFVAVEPGGVIVRSSIRAPRALDARLVALDGGTCSFWVKHPGSRNYFAWHRSEIFRG